MSEWIDIKDKRPSKDCKVNVKTQKHQELTAFYYMDDMQWIKFYGQQTTNWWNSKHPHEPIYDVIYWKEISDEH